MINNQESQQQEVIPNPLMSPLKITSTDAFVTTPLDSSPVHNATCYQSILFELDMIKKNRIMSNLKYMNNKYKNKNYTFYRIWVPRNEVPIKAKIFLLHEVHEHLGRWESLATKMAEQGYAVYAMDFYNHGRSSGTPKGYIEHWKLFELQAKLFLENEILTHADLTQQQHVEDEKYESDTSSSSEVHPVTESQQWKHWKLRILQDMSPYTTSASEEWEAKLENLQQQSYPIVLGGYGFGATMSLLLSLHYQEAIHRTISLAPYVHTPTSFSSLNASSSMLLSQQQLIRSMNYFFPMLEIVSMNTLPQTHDVQQRNWYSQDPLLSKTKLRCNTLYQLLDAAKRISQLLMETKHWHPHVLLLHGAEDVCSPSDASRYTTHLLADKNYHSFTLQIYPDMYHDILHETNYRKAIEDILLWLAKRIV